MVFAARGTLLALEALDQTLGFRASAVAPRECPRGANATRDLIEAMRPG